MAEERKIDVAKAEGLSEKTYSYWAMVWRRFRRHRIAVIALGTLIFIFLFSFLGGLVWHVAPDDTVPYYEVFRDVVRRTETIPYFDKLNQQKVEPEYLMLDKELQNLIFSYNDVYDKLYAGELTMGYLFDKFKSYTDAAQRVAKDWQQIVAEGSKYEQEYFPYQRVIAAANAEINKYQNVVNAWEEISQYVTSEDRDPDTQKKVVNALNVVNSSLKTSVTLYPEKIQVPDEFQDEIDRLSKDAAPYRDLAEQLDQDLQVYSDYMEKVSLYEEAKSNLEAYEKRNFDEELQQLEQKKQMLLKIRSSLRDILSSVTPDDVLEKMPKKIVEIAGPDAEELGQQLAQVACNTMGSCEDPYKELYKVLSDMIEQVDKQISQVKADRKDYYATKKDIAYYERVLKKYEQIDPYGKLLADAKAIFIDKDLPGFVDTELVPTWQQLTVQAEQHLDRLKEPFAKLVDKFLPQLEEEWKDYPDFVEKLRSSLAGVEDPYFRYTTLKSIVVAQRAEFERIAQDYGKFYYGYPMAWMNVGGVKADKTRVSLLNLVKFPHLPPFSEGHPLGTDDKGRDVLARLIFGGQVSLLVGLLAMIVSVAVGAVVGLTAGYYGGWWDSLSMRFVDIMMNIPALPLLLALSQALRKFSNFFSETLHMGAVGGALPIALVLAIWSWMGLARIVRGQVLSVREMQYVEAAKAIGSPASRIIFKHILPNVSAAIIVAATLRVGTAILSEASLSFLGFGVQPPATSWGQMLQNATQIFNIPGYMYLIILPGTLLFVTVLAFNFLGDGLRDALDPRMKL